MIDKKFLLPKIDKQSALPAANQLARQLTWLIADDVINEGEKLPPIREYAEVLSIHHHTVRAAYHLLESKSLVSMQPRVGTVVQKYIPFSAGSQNEYLNSDMIGILVPSISDFYREVISGIEDVAHESRLIPMILSCHEDPIYAEALYKNLSSRNVNGIINISLGFSDEFHQTFKRPENFNVPLVFLDVADADTHSLTIDTLAAIELAASHMLDHGYDDLALVNCPADLPVGRDALIGFRRALEKRGLTVNHQSVFTVPDFGYNAGQFVIERMLNEGSLPRAIVTVSDNLAIGAISKLKESGFQVPQDVAVIGFNDILPASITDPALSTIGLPLYEMGKQAMQALNKVMGRDVRTWIQTKFSGCLVIRESCGCQNQSSENGEKS